MVVGLAGQSEEDLGRAELEPAQSRHSGVHGAYAQRGLHPLAAAAVGDLEADAGPLAGAVAGLVRAGRDHQPTRVLDVDHTRGPHPLAGPQQAIAPQLQQAEEGRIGPEGERRPPAPQRAGVGGQGLARLDHVEVDLPSGVEAARRRSVRHHLDLRTRLDDGALRPQQQRPARRQRQADPLGDLLTQAVAQAQRQRHAAAVAAVEADVEAHGGHAQGVGAGAERGPLPHPQGDPRPHGRSPVRVAGDHVDPVGHAPHEAIVLRDHAQLQRHRRVGQREVGPLRAPGHVGDPRPDTQLPGGVRGELLGSAQLEVEAHPSAAV